MDKAKDEAINKLISGQEKMGKDISGMKGDISGMKGDISDLKNGQVTMKKDISELKTDVSGLKQGQQHLETMMVRMIEETTFVKNVVIKIENDLNPKVKTLFDADKVRQNDTTELKQVCREHDNRLEDHELRISRLEE